MFRMNKIKRFIDNGVLLTPSAYEKIKNLDEERLNELLETESLFLKDFKRKTDNGEEDHGDDRETGEEGTTLEIIKKQENTQGKYKISDFVDYYNRRFNKLKDIVKKRIDIKDLISINKLSSYGLEGTIIGIVRKIEDDYFVIEDNTSSVKVESGENLIEDEVVGIKGKKNKEKFVAEKIYYPNISFKREVNTLNEEVKALFLTSLDSGSEGKVKDVISEENVNYIFISDNDSEYSEDILEGLHLEGVLISDDSKAMGNKVGGVRGSTNPTWSRISNKITILQYNAERLEEYKDKLNKDSPKDVTLELLKRRHLDPLGKNFFKDILLLDKLPDIIHCGNLNNFSVYNYKGTTVVNTTPDEAVLINLGTREFEKIDLESM